MTSTQSRPSGPKHILIARPAAVFAEDVTDAYVTFEVRSESDTVGTATTPRFTGQPAKMVREWKGEYKIPVSGEVKSLDIKLFGKVAGDRVAPEGEDLLVASGYLDSRDMRAFYGFHRVLLQFGNHSVKWEVTFVIQPGQGTTSSVSRSMSLMSRASSQGLSERLGSLGLTLDNTSIYSESGVPQSPSARSIASSRPPPSQSGISKGPPSRGPPLQGPPGSPGNSPNNSPIPSPANGGPRGTDFSPSGSPFNRSTPDASPQDERALPPNQPAPLRSSGSGDRKGMPTGPSRDEPNMNGMGSRHGSPTGSLDQPRTSGGPDSMPGMMHKPTINLPSPGSSGSPQTRPPTGLMTNGIANGPSRAGYQNGPSSTGSYKLAGSGYGATGQGLPSGTGENRVSGGTGGYGAGAGGDNVMDIKIFTRPGGAGGAGGGGGDEGMEMIGSGFSNSRVPSRGYGSVSRNVKTAGACMCSQEYFTVREDRPVVREVTDYILEHHLFEREYVRQVRYRGEHEVVNTSAAVELIKADERTLAVSQPADPCAALANPARSPAEELRALAQASSAEGGVSTPRNGSNVMHVREGTMGSRNSPGSVPGSLTGAVTPREKLGMDSIGRSPFASQNGLAQAGGVQASQATGGFVTTTVTTKIEPPPKPQAELCKQEVFRQVEDRPVLKQRTRFIREHHIFEKTYVREVKYAGEMEVMTQQAPELIRTEERIVEVTQPGNPCALIRDGLNLDRMSQVPGGFSAGSHGLMTSGHTYTSQGMVSGGCAGGVCKPGAGAYSKYAQSSEGMASGKFSSTFSERPGPLHTFQNSGNFPRKPLKQTINRAGLVTPTNKGYMG